MLSSPSVKSHILLRLAYSKELAHTLNALLFLIEVWMHIQIERCRHIGMTKYNAHCFIIALAFYAAGCKCVPKPMKYDLRYAETL